MHVLYNLPTFTIKKQLNVGKYTSPMDGMGKDPYEPISIMDLDRAPPGVLKIAQLGYSRITKFNIGYSKYLDVYEPGDSSRDLFIPKRWRSLNLSKRSQKNTIPKRLQSQNCRERNYFVVESMLLGLFDISRFSVGSLEGTARKTSMEWTIMDIMECLKKMVWKTIFPFKLWGFLVSSR